ncbi:hypothetical protein BB561_001543 [Smittium simulii]|uniref:RING-type E3 ubiquitin transferase n=1 Tax=Smittium simulii TaxID=133385 RepID=A0A2T9YU64_9FUNG|nr:hypothetical protein BB561_001543 [Smittium simulii]
MESSVTYSSQDDFILLHSNSGKKYIKGILTFIDPPTQCIPRKSDPILYGRDLPIIALIRLGTCDETVFLEQSKVIGAVAALFYKENTTSLELEKLFQKIDAKNTKGFTLCLIDGNIGTFTHLQLINLAQQSFLMGNLDSQKKVLLTIDSRPYAIWYYINYKKIQKKIAKNLSVFRDKNKLELFPQSSLSIFKTFKKEEIEHNQNFNKNQKKNTLFSPIKKSLNFGKYKFTAKHSSICTICVNEIHNQENVRFLPCGHYFHIECIDDHLTNISALCPICKFNTIDALILSDKYNVKKYNSISQKAKMSNQKNNGRGIFKTKDLSSKSISSQKAFIKNISSKDSSSMVLYNFEKKRFKILKNT